MAKLFKNLLKLFYFIIQIYAYASLIYVVNRIIVYFKDKKYDNLSFNSWDPSMKETTDMFKHIYYDKPNKLSKLIENSDESFDIDQNSKNKCTAVHIASNLNRPECLELLLKHKADPDIASLSTGSTPLIESLKHDDYKCLNVLLTHKANPNLLDFNNGTTPLGLVIENNNTKIIEVLLYGKADPNIQFSKDYSKLTPLHYSIMYNKTNIIKTLIRCKADLNKNIASHGTPLIKCIQTGKIKYLKLLIEAKANFDKKQDNVSCNGWNVINQKYVTKKSPLEIAEQYGNTQIIDILKDRIKKKIDEKIKSALNSSCPICYDDMVDPQSLKITKCYHVYHKSCWSDFIIHEKDNANNNNNIYLYTNASISCPYCNETLDQEDLDI